MAPRDADHPRHGVIAETADRVAVMYCRRIAEIGPVRDVIKSPLHPLSRA